MTTFPALIPSSRTFTPGEYPATAFSGYSGVQNRVRHSNVFLAAQLRLTFLGLTQAQMLDIWNHYNGRRGEFRSFELPAEVVSYGSITDYVPGTYIWRYAGPGSVEDLPCGGHNVSLTLETVPPAAASVVGAQLFLQVRLSTGGANGGEYVLGINETATLSLSAGDAFTALNGTNQSLTLSLSAGTASGDIEVNGSSLSIYLALATQSAASLNAMGANQTITFSLAAGAANGATDPNFSSVALLLHMNGSNGSTTFTDSSSSARTVTANGDARISTSRSKFGGASGLFDGSGDYLTVTVPGGLGSGSFTVEFWYYMTANTGVLFNSRSNGIGSDGIDIFSNLFVTTAGNQIFQPTSTPINEWHHVAIVRSGSTMTRYINGVADGGTSTVSNNFNASAFLIGGSTAGNVGYLNGNIDELRITVGFARYTANFTPPTAAFPNS
jgi:hypothetical protein